MKNIIFACLSIAFWASCSEAPKPAAVAAPAPVISDSAAVADVIHGFYKWYDAFTADTINNISFVDDKGKHLKLDPAKMAIYFNNFKKTGFVSDAFIEGEYAFYKKCEVLWQKEAVDEVPSGMDADKYYCAQDWDNAFWTNSPVRIKPAGENMVTATLYGKLFDEALERNFTLKKENGKWLLTNIECDMGVE